MTTTPDEPKVNPSHPRTAAEWGLASLLLGGVLALMAMHTLQINLQMFLSPRAWSSHDVRLIHDIAILGAIVLAGLTGASVAFGIRSVAIAYLRAQPCGLGWAGLLISALALVLWAFTFFDLFEVLNMLMH